MVRTYCDMIVCACCEPADNRAKERDGMCQPSGFPVFHMHQQCWMLLDLPGKLLLACNLLSPGFWLQKPDLLLVCIRCTQNISIPLGFTETSRDVEKHNKRTGSYLSFLPGPRGTHTAFTKPQRTCRLYTTSSASGQILLMAIRVVSSCDTAPSDSSTRTALVTCSMCGQLCDKAPPYIPSCSRNVVCCFLGVSAEQQKEHWQQHA